MEKTFKVSFIRENITLESAGDETLLSLMQRAGIEVDAPCGGQGKCGKCTVTVEGRGEVRSCRTIVDEDMTVDTSGAALRSDDVQILRDSFLENGDGRPSGENVPHLRLVSVKVPPCPAGQSISDWTRFSKEVSDQLPGLRLQPSPQAASAVGPLSRSVKNEAVYALLYGDRVLRLSADPLPYYMAAFDIGTTTLAAYLLDGRDGREAARASCMNPQTRFGADVIGRANYSLENGMEPVSSCIREAVNDLLGQLADEAGISREEIWLLSFAGNTCMHHLFLGICVDSLVHAPYNPAVSEEMVLRASDYGIRAAREARMLMLPNIAGFVGADTVACLVSSRLAEQKEWTLLIDIGTNGEMVLGKDHEMAACSTAAGPAFEGAGISCGMRGSAGAVSKAKWKEGRWDLQVIGGGKIKGICGSGILDLTAGLLESGQMDEYGELQEADRVVLASGEESAGGEEVAFTQKDVRQVQLAKAAIATGVRLLAKKLGVELNEISKVWLAGAFGSFLSPDSACAIGLIPPELAGRITPVGNAAGEGAKEVLRDARQWEYAKKLAREVSFLELASMKEFNDCYMDELIFPEPD